MTQFQYSAKLSKYLNKVETETGRKIEYHFVTNLRLDAGAAFSAHPSCIKISLTKDTDWGNPEHEHTIAHEATHGYLTYKLGYSCPRLKRKPRENEIKHVELLWMMIDDIVVNRIMQKEGFPPFAPIYLNKVEKETKDARKGSDRVCDGFSDDPLLRDRFMVFRYILAWGLIRYCDLEPYARRIINKYLKAFEKSFVQQSTIANQAKEVILQHDIFSVHGRREALEAVARLWHLDDLIEFSST